MWAWSAGASSARPAHPQAVSLLEAEPDINQLTDFFSYEHFYVIYCKFWELDADHDLMIDRRDLARHADGGKAGSRAGGGADVGRGCHLHPVLTSAAISSKIIDRVFSGAVTRYDPVLWAGPGA